MSKDFPKSRLMGADTPTKEHHRCVNAFIRNSYAKRPSHEKPNHPSRRRTKHSAARANSGSGLEWLKAFADFKGNDCLLYPYRTTANPRGTVNYNRKSMGAHRAMCFLVHRMHPEDKPDALHKCGNGHLGCVNPSHLYWGDHGDNVRDGHRHTVEGKPNATAPKMADGV